MVVVKQLLTVSTAAQPEDSPGWRPRSLGMAGEAGQGQGKPGGRQNRIAGEQVRQWWGGEEGGLGPGREWVWRQWQS